MIDFNKVYKLKSYGNEYDVKIKQDEYTDNGNFALIMDYYDEEFKDYAPFAVMTINFEDLPFNQAYLDVNNCPWVTSFVEENHLGKWTGCSAASGFCEYPLYEFDIEKGD